MTFDEWVTVADGYDCERIAEILSVSVRQVRRYRATTMPPSFVRLLQYELHGRMPGAPWHAWRVRADGRLYAPDLARGFTPEDLRTLHWLQQAHAWRDARARLAQSTTLLPRPSPAPIPAR